MNDIMIEDIKSKFDKLQSELQNQKELKIKYESQLSTLQAQYDEQLQQILKDTGTTSLEDAITFCKGKKEELESIKESVSKELDQYLSTLSGSNETQTQSSDIGDFFL